MNPETSGRPSELAGGGFDLALLLHPHSPALFFQEYWARKPLIVSRKRPDYYAGLFSQADVDRVLAATEMKYPDLRMYRGGQVLPAHQYTQPDGTARVSELYEAYHQQGYSLLLSSLQKFWEPLAVLCRNLERAFHCPASILMLMTPPGAQGLSPHSDNVEVLVVALTGSKRWRIYARDPAIQLEGQGTLVPREELGPPLHEFTLEAGDFLYLPRGYVHEAVTTEASSLHLTIGISAYRWMDLLLAAVNALGSADPRIQQYLPIPILPPNPTPAGLEAELRSQLEHVARSATLEGALERLTDRFLRGLAPLPPGSSSHFSTLETVGALELTTPVHRRRGMLCQVRHQSGQVCIQFPGNQVVGPASIEPALRFIASREHFTPAELPGDFDDPSRLVLVRRLIREGLLSVG